MTLVNETTTTQCSQILEILQSGGSITQSEAYKSIGTQRLPSRIWDLREKGHDIVFVWESGKNRHGRPVSFKRYYLKEFAPENAKQLPVKETKPTPAENRVKSALAYYKENRKHAPKEPFENHWFMNQLLKETIQIAAYGNV